METIQLLYVDDEIAWLNIIAKVLNDQGFKVDTVEDGEKAMAYMRSKHYDMVLLDIRLKGEDGWQLIYKLKQQDPWSAIILYTSAFDIEKFPAVQGMGAEDYLEKSVDLKPLINRLKGLYLHYQMKKAQSEIFQITQDVTFVSGNGCLQVKGKEYFLKSTETKLLYSLCKHMSKVVATNDLCQNIRGKSELDTKEKSLRNLISQVRKYFEGTSIKIKKIRFEGYYLYT